MKKKLLAAVLSCAMTCMLFAGCGATKEEASTEAESVTEVSEDAESKEVSEESEEVSTDSEEGRDFIVGFDAEFPPFGYLDEESGEYVGFDLSLAEEVCNRLGWNLVKQPIDWDSKDSELSSGSIDCIWNGFTINGREDSYTWTEAYVDNSQVFVVAGDSEIEALSDLAGKTVAVQKDSSALAALNDEEVPENVELKKSFKDLIEYSDYNTAFMDLEAGAVDAVAIDIGVAQYQVSNREEGAYVILSEKLATEQYGVGFLKGNEELRDKVQNVLDEMAEDGTFMEIEKEWGLEDSVCLGK
ncbi:MAG: amino acid ABC transporter substrate-binding protein [Lachnospiraceae bacterium]|nr:amino acid ABC transporter substrate-binding protein [Lachnospiraceae bacterium]